MNNKIQVMILEQPFQITELQKNEMRNIFSNVMEGISFYAESSFFPRLLECPIIILMYLEGELVGFGTACRREAGGYQVTHIMSAYVLKKYQRNGVLIYCYSEFIKFEIIRNKFCLDQMLYITASTVNPQVLKAMEKLAPVWPDLSGRTKASSVINNIIFDTIKKYYPSGSNIPYQALITEEMAGVRSEAENHSTGDESFDQEFYKIADPKERKLLVFCAEIGAVQAQYFFV